jgi:hypothetical protein
MVLFFIDIGRHDSGRLQRGDRYANNAIGQMPSPTEKPTPMVSWREL